MAVHGKRRIAQCIGRSRDKDMGDPSKCSLIKRPLAVEENGGKTGRTQQILSFGVSASAGHRPARGGEPTAERQRAVAQAETEEMRRAHDGCRIAAGSASSVSAMRVCLSRVQAQKPHETRAPTASGKRNPKCPLKEPISTAPTAGPARKIMP